MKIVVSFSGSSWTYDSRSQISAAVQTDLKQIYVSVCFHCIAVAVGAYLDILWNIGGLLTIFATLGCMSWLLTNPPYEQLKRVLLSMAFSLLGGASIGSLLKLATDCDHLRLLKLATDCDHLNCDHLSILVSICIGVSIPFACFIGAAMLARRRDLFYLGGFLSSGVSIFFWLQFCLKIFGGAVALLQFELYLGLLVVVAYFVVDSVKTFEKACEDLDYVNEEIEEEEEYCGVVCSEDIEEEEEESVRSGEKMHTANAVNFIL